jgi:hypothetical protein
MPESESEDEILDRIEVALRRIAGAVQSGKPASKRDIDREALAHSLDMLVARLRAGLEPAKPDDHVTE